MINEFFVEVYRSGRLFSRGWRWRIKALNGETLADSGQSYVRRPDAVHGLEQVVGLSLPAMVGAPGVRLSDVVGQRVHRVAEHAIVREVQGKRTGGFVDYA